MSAWQALPWHEARWSSLTAAAAAGRLGHALLLAGPRGVGKGHFARGLAAWLLCEGEGRPCGACRSCTQLAAGSHPNALWLSTEGLYCATLDASRQEAAIPLWLPDKDSRKREIAVDAIRELIARLGLSTHYGQSRLALVDPADALNASGINALLKTIEEPPAGTHVVLVAERWRALPATLRSRCQILRFAPPPASQALAWLKKHHPDAPVATLQALARAPLRAAAQLEADVAATREQWGRALGELLEGRLTPLALAGKLRREEAQAALEQWQEVATGWLAATLAPGRTTGAPPPPQARPELLEGLLEASLEGLRALEHNAQPTLVVESIMIRLSERAAASR